MSDILQELTALKADFSAANALLEEAKNSQESLKAELASALATVTAKDAELAEAAKVFAANDEELKAALSEIATLKEAQKSANETAAEIVAAQGIKPLKVDKKETASAKTKEEIVAEYNGITDPTKRGAFFAAHRAVIFDKKGAE